MGMRLWVYEVGYCDHGMGCGMLQTIVLAWITKTRRWMVGNAESIAYMTSTGSNNLQGSEYYEASVRVTLYTSEFLGYLGDQPGACRVSTRPSCSTVDEPTTEQITLGLCAVYKPLNANSPAQKTVH